MDEGDRPLSIVERSVSGLLAIALYMGKPSSAVDGDDAMKAGMRRELVSEAEGED